MDRRAVLLAVTLALLRLTPTRAATTMGAPWKQVPSITVFSDPGDARLPLVRDAVTFWNRMLEQLGSRFRLGAITVRNASAPAGALRAMSEATVGTGALPPMPGWLGGMAGQIVVVLSDDNFVSFTAHWSSAATALVAIKSDRAYPLTLPNVARNVIAHELGHAIGLGHNGDPTMLMCGRPASCRPDLFASPTERYFPLADDEKSLLLRLYPAGWRPA